MEPFLRLFTGVFVGVDAACEYQAAGNHVGQAHQVEKFSWQL